MRPYVVDTRRCIGGDRGRIRAKLRQIDLIVTDVDGILTDGKLWYGPTGEEIKVFNALDGFGMGLLRRADIQVAVLSGRDCPALRTRLSDLHITHFRLGQRNKKEVFQELLEEVGVSPSRTAYIGDDLQDAELFGCCALGITVPNAPSSVRRLAALITRRSGGAGAFREVTDMILQAKTGSSPYAQAGGH